MPAVNNSSISCGVRQLFDFYYDYQLESEDSPVAVRKLVVAVINDFEITGTYSQLVFSDARCQTHRGHEKRCAGGNLAAYIRKNKGLGHITATKYVENRNTGNLISTWVWTLPTGETAQCVQSMKEAIKYTKSDRRHSIW